MEGRIHSFQSLGTVDGPGLRCVVFMQGCPLRCACCHNPDTWQADGGTPVNVDALVAKIVRFRPYFGTKGGVTVSGGEPLLQAAFVRDLFEKLKKCGIHTALDTSGCIWNDTVAQVLAHTDLVLLDHKYADAEAYRQNTRCEKRTVEQFLAELQNRNIPTWLRRVIIPGLTDSEADTKALVEIAKAHPCVQKVELLPFRKLCIEKYRALGIPFPLEATPEPTEEKMQQLNEIVRAFCPKRE